MNCDHVKLSLSSYLDGELAQAEAARIAGHLLTCADCGAEHDVLKRASRMVRDLPLKALPPGFLARLKQRHCVPKPDASFPWPGPKPLALTAVMLLLGFVIAGPWQAPRLAQAPGITPASTAASSISNIDMATTRKPSRRLGASYGAKAAMTNEQLHKALQQESDRLGLAAAPQEDETRSQPFLGERLGQPGTRAQAEFAIRQFAAMRRSVEQGAGKESTVPIAGSVAPVLGQGEEQRGKAIAPGQALSDGFWSGEYAASNEGTRTIKDQVSWAALWRTLSTSPPPAVDFAKAQIIAVFLGPRPTGGYSVELTELKRTAHSFVVRYREHLPVAGQSPPEGATSPYALKAVPRTDLPIRFEKAR